MSFPPLTAVDRPECAFSSGGAYAEPQQNTPSLMQGEAQTEILLTPSWQHSYLFARSENIKHNKPSLLHKAFYNSLLLAVIHKSVAIQSGNIAKSRKSV